MELGTFLCASLYIFVLGLAAFTRGDAAFSRYLPIINLVNATLMILTIGFTMYAREWFEACNMDSTSLPGTIINADYAMQVPVRISQLLLFFQLMFWRQNTIETNSNNNEQGKGKKQNPLNRYRVHWPSLTRILFSWIFCRGSYFILALLKAFINDNLCHPHGLPNSVSGHSWWYIFSPLTSMSLIVSLERNPGYLKSYFHPKFFLRCFQCDLRFRSYICIILLQVMIIFSGLTLYFTYSHGYHTPRQMIFGVMYGLLCHAVYLKLIRGLLPHKLSSSLPYNTTTTKRKKRYINTGKVLFGIYMTGLISCIFMPKIINTHTSYLRRAAYTPLLLIDIIGCVFMTWIYFNKLLTPVSGFVSYDSIIPSVKPKDIEMKTNKVPVNFRYDEDP